MTNLDRLRKMSDKEIFYFIKTEKFCLEIPEEECYKHNSCKDCRITWLKKEYKGDGNND